MKPKRRTTATVLDIMAEQSDSITLEQMMHDPRLNDAQPGEVRAILKKQVSAGVLAQVGGGYEVPIDEDPPDRYHVGRRKRPPVPRKPA